MTTMYHLAIIDDNLTFLEQFNAHFEHSELAQCVLKAQSVAEFLQKINNLDETIDIIFLDIYLAGESGIEAVPTLKKYLPEAEIIMLSVSEEAEHLFRALCLGVGGYLLKDNVWDNLNDYLKIHQSGGSLLSAKMARYIVQYFNPKPTDNSLTLTGKNIQVLHLLAEGWNYKSIAAHLDISLNTVRYHIKEIYRALGV